MHTARGKCRKFNALKCVIRDVNGTILLLEHTFTILRRTKTSFFYFELQNQIIFNIFGKLPVVDEVKNTQYPIVYFCTQKRSSCQMSELMSTLRPNIVVLQCQWGHLNVNILNNRKRFLGDHVTLQLSFANRNQFYFFYLKISTVEFEFRADYDNVISLSARWRWRQEVNKFKHFYYEACERRVKGKNMFITCCCTIRKNSHIQMRHCEI